VVLVRRWPLIAALICTAPAWTTHALGLRLNASPRAPRGVYRTVARPPARDTLVAVCLPAGLADVARERDTSARVIVPAAFRRRSSA
jgi:type IV secretory pathway protease TraF